MLLTFFFLTVSRIIFAAVITESCVIIIRIIHLATSSQVGILFCVVLSEFVSRIFFCSRVLQ